MRYRATAQAPTRTGSRCAGALLLVLAIATSGFAQTRIVPPANKYSPAEDVKLGQEAAAQARKELPLLRDPVVDAYIDSIGQKLAAAIPPDYRHPEFHFTFEVVNQKEINAFALPGGPMFLNRGMIEAAKSEGEIAGVMAHEMAHVVLRHGTAQATKGEKFQIGALLGQIAGAVVGGTAGGLIAQGSQFGLGTWFLKYSREYESQADIFGAQMMARAGYDPREMANMFKTLEEQGGNGVPEFFSSHPNPGNRYDAILKEARLLQVHGNANSGQFQQIQSRLRTLGREYTAEEIARGEARANNGATPPATVSKPASVPPPSSSMRTYRPADFFRVSVPANWTASADNGQVTYAPPGAIYNSPTGGSGFTHGVQFGLGQGASGDLRRDTQTLIDGFERSNPQLETRSLSRDRLGNRTGLTAQLTNVSEASGQPEIVVLTTAQLADGRLLYMIGVAPRSQANTYQATFQRIRKSVQVTDN